MAYDHYYLIFIILGRSQEMDNNVTQPFHKQQNLFKTLQNGKCNPSFESLFNVDLDVIIFFRESFIETGDFSLKIGFFV